jgi:hypothetical protein
MEHLVHERDLLITDENGAVYDHVRVYAVPHTGTTWAGFIEFAGADGGPSLRTERETTQSTVAAVTYWATGLEPLYFEGALERARRRVGNAA